VTTSTKQGYRFRRFEEFACISSRIHQFHPAVILLAAFSYITLLTSFPATAVIELAPYFLFPILLAQFARIPLKPLFASTLKVLPMILLIGFLHPFLDKELAYHGSMELNRGWFIFISLMLKGFLTILMNFLMISILGIGGLQKAMKSMKIPPLFFMLFTLIYRYIMLLLEDLYRTLRAYELRSGRKPRLTRNEWGSLPGGILIRTYEQGLRVQHAMELRGFNPAHPYGSVQKLSIPDIVFIMLWLSLVVLFRIYSLPEVLGSVLVAFCGEGAGLGVLHG